METKSTNSLDNSQVKNLIDTLSKTPDTVVVPGMSPRPPQPSNSGESTPRMGLWRGLYWPLRRTAILLGGILTVVLILSGLFSLAKNTISNLTSLSSTPPNQSAEQTKIETSKSDKLTTTTNNCTDLPTRMAKAKVTGAQIDLIFSQKHPDRLKNPISGGDSDRELRQEWCEIGNKFIDRK